MNNNSNNVTGPQSDFLGGMSSIDFEDEMDMEEEGGCDVYEAVMKAIFLSRPLGILWDDDIIEEFLKSVGYKIIERTDEDGEIYTVPVKVGSKIIPDKHDTLRRVFDREIQKTLLKWLIKINKE